MTSMRDTIFGSYIEESVTDGFSELVTDPLANASPECKKGYARIQTMWRKIMKIRDTNKKNKMLKRFFEGLKRFNRLYKCGFEKLIEQIRRASYPPEKLDADNFEETELAETDCTTIQN